MAKYRLVLEKYPKTPAGEKLKVVVRLREMEEKARELYRSYDFEGASKAFAKLADEDPSRKPLADYFEVLCLYGQLRDEEALAKAREIADNGTDAAIRAEVTLWIAKFAYNARQWGESSRLFAAYADQRSNAPQAPAALVWAARAAFADNDFEGAVKMVTKLVERYPASPERARGYLIQGESLIELARFDEAVLVLERAMLAEGATDEDRFKAQVMKADALFVMGADNPARYREALDAYRAVRQGEALSPDMKIAVSFKIGRTLEKLKRSEDAIDQFYSEVVVAYREGIRNGVVYGDEAGACFAKAAFLLADEYESRGKDFQAMHVLELVVASDVPASDEAEKRIDRIQTKGRIL
jgi:tetratricopeptide (TPR) repeat protein